MTTNVVNTLKNIGLIATVFFTLTSCEKEIDSIGVTLIDNNYFNPNSITAEVEATTLNIEKVPANGQSQYLLGVYADNEFGKLEASIVSQIVPPATGESYTYGENVKIDSVLVHIPYQATSDGNDTDGKPFFKIDSVFGDADTEFQLKVFELKTFLNVLDPANPAQPAVYYSDKEFLKGDTPLFSGNFKINENDTVAYIKRYLNDGITVYDTDTIKEDGSIPSIKIPLNEDLIKQLLVDTAKNSDFDSFDNFRKYFRGLLIESVELNNPYAHLVSLDLVGAKMAIYYSIDQDEGPDEDLNGNGTNGETGVRTKGTYNFSFGSIKSNVYKRDYSTSKQSGSERLYVQGASGSNAIIELSPNDFLEGLRDKNWLVNEANLVFYVDQEASSNIVPEQLFIYNYDDNEQVTDVMTEGLNTVGGLLEYDDDGNPYRYVFKITDFVSNLIKQTDPTESTKLGLKVYNSTDLPTSRLDTQIRTFNWNPKGVVLFDHNENAGDKKLKLELFYTEINK